MRSLNTIAREIKLDWGTKVHYSAKPYLSAMLQLDKISDQYGDDNARMIVAYFLANARTWKGDTAKRVKLELNTMLKG
jgi:hypothetical protein